MQVQLHLHCLCADKNHMLWIWLVCQKSEQLCQQAIKIFWCTPDPLRVGSGYEAIFYFDTTWEWGNYGKHQKYMQQSAISKYSSVYYATATKQALTQLFHVSLINHQEYLPAILSGKMDAACGCGQTQFCHSAIAFAHVCDFYSNLWPKLIWESVLGQG